MFARMCKYGGVRLHAFVSHIYLAHVCVCIHDAACFFAVVLMRHLCLSTSVSFSVDLCIYFLCVTVWMLVSLWILL